MHTIMHITTTGMFFVGNVFLGKLSEDAGAWGEDDGAVRCDYSNKRSIAAMISVRYARADWAIRVTARYLRQECHVRQSWHYRTALTR